MEIDLSKINLNLLVALDALLQEQQVTKAGIRLHLTQSAVSNLLRQLRVLFQDELFIRGQKSQMIPTAKALALATPVRVWLQTARALLTAEAPFQPKQDAETFHIGLADYGEFVILPVLIPYLLTHAPYTTIAVQRISYLPTEQLFENNQLDMCIGPFATQIPAGLITETLFPEEMILVGWNQNPLLTQPVTPEIFAHAPKILPLYYERPEETMTDQFLKAAGLSRQMTITLPSFTAALHNLVGTPLICHVMKRVALEFAKHLPLALQAPAFRFPPIPINMVWHPKDRNNRAHEWLRQTVRALFKVAGNPS